MAVYGAGKWLAIVRWKGWRESDTHKFMSRETRDRFIRENQRNSRISKLEKDPK